MYTPENENSTMDYTEISYKILARLEMEYKYASAKAVDKPEMIKFLASQLRRLSNREVICWNEALNNISDKGGKHPPTIPEIMSEIRKVGIATQPNIAIEKKEIPFASSWNMETDSQRLEDVRAWLEFCPKKMPQIMLNWVVNQEEDVKAELRRIKKKDVSQIIKHEDNT